MNSLAESCLACGFHERGTQYCSLRKVYIPTPMDTDCRNRATRATAPDGPIMARGILWPDARVPWHWDCEPLARVLDGECASCGRVGGFHLMLKLPGMGGQRWFCDNAAYENWWGASNAGHAQAERVTASPDTFAAYLEGIAREAVRRAPTAHMPDMAVTPEWFVLHASPEAPRPARQSGQRQTLEFTGLYILELAAYAKAYVPLVAEGRMSPLMISNFLNVDADRRITIAYPPGLCGAEELQRLRREADFTSL